VHLLHFLELRQQFARLSAGLTVCMFDQHPLSRDVLGTLDDTPLGLVELINEHLVIHKKITR
jgi:hypothetical protein